MSRIARNPIAVPKGVEVNITPVQISVKGPLGTIARPMDPNVGVEKDGETLKCKALGN
jgi:large subunit ribosomal protein L6